MSTEIFENIELKNLVKLYNILENNLEYLDNAKLQYSKQNIYLRESLNFLIGIDIISVEGNNIKIHDKSSDEIEDKIFNKIAESSEFGLEVLLPKTSEELFVNCAEESLTPKNDLFP